MNCVNNAQLSSPGRLEKWNEVFELVIIEIVTMVVGTNFNSRYAYKFIGNGSNLI